MTQLRLVKVMPFFTPATQFGGVVTQAALVCAGLAARGHRVRVVTTDIGLDDATPRNEWVELEGYEVFYASTRPWHRVVPYWTPTIAAPLESVLAEADLCCLNVGLTLTNRLASRIANRRGVPYIYNAEGALCPTRLRLKGRRKAAFLASVERPLLAGAAACHAVTEKEARDLQAQDVAASKIVTIPNGVPPYVPGDANRFRSRFGIDPEERIVLHLGRLHAIKGVDMLVEAFGEAAPKNTCLVLAGHDDDGAGRDAAARAAEGHFGGEVILTGHLAPPWKRDALAAADLFALFSRTEGLPNAALEALAAGLPCLLTQQCNLPEVEDAGAGRVLPASFRGLTEALGEMLKDPLSLRRMGDRARSLAADRFDMSRILDELEATYEQLAVAKTPIQ